MRARVFTIPPHLPFLDCLAAGLIAETGDDPLALARATVLLPTRRAARALREAFLRQSPARALVLPRLRALGDLGDDEGGIGDEGLDLAPALPVLRRRLLLTRLVMARGGVLPGQAASLAGELARFLDEAAAEGVALERGALDALVPAEHAAHWQEVLRFLEILIESWPAVLRDEGALDPAARRNAALDALGRSWRAAPLVQGQVIAAGLGGSMPAVAALLREVALLPEGRIVLAGLDPTIGEAERDDEGHPQHSLALLLAKLGIAAAGVPEWPTRLPGGPPERATLVALAMRPAESASWLGASVPDAALEGLRRIDCASPQEEALAIALLLRGQLEHEGRTAILVTPDRALARRVAGELRRWAIAIDDSAGVPLARTPPGAFLRLLVEAATELAPVPLLAALKHPLAAGGRATGAFRALVRRLEQAALRGPRPAGGFSGLREACRRKAELVELVALLEDVLAPVVDALGAPETNVPTLLASLVAAAERLAETDDETGAARLWAGEAGEAGARFIAELAEAAQDFPPIRGEDWPALFEALLAGPVVRPRFGRHPRLALLGLLEARLQHADLVVLGGLNEGTWPAEPAADPWMSRPMRHAFGLAAPELRVGEQAHDFAQSLGAREVVLTRATRVDGTPTVPSRWLQRLEAVLDAAGRSDALKTRQEVLGWTTLLDRPAVFRTPERPRPRPPVEARPRALSVTQVERWTHDPYAIFARHILGLQKLDPVDADPGAAERGQFVHAALDAFVKLHPGPLLPADAVDRLEELGRAILAETLKQPGVWAFWWPRFRRVARWFVETETARRRDIAACATEIDGRLVVGGFTLTAKADRIDTLRDGSLVLVDYKTGKPPGLDDVAMGRAPQLPLEAAIAEEGGFRDLAAARVGGLEYWHVSGLRSPGAIVPLAADAADVRRLAAEAIEGLRALVARFADPAMPYVPLARLKTGKIYGDYLHLARVKEWMPAVEIGE